MFTRNSIVLSNNIKTPLTAISRAIGNILQLTYGQLVKQLFSNGEQGFFYDPNDLSTMFQDSAGTIPVTGAGQPVGLMLDKSKGLVLSNELVTNGDFSNGLSGWSVQNGTSVIVNGAARVTATSTAQPQLYMPAAFLAGKRIEISVDFMNRTGGTGIFVGLYSAALGIVVSVTSNNASSVVKIKATIPLGFDGGLYCRLNSPTAGSYVDFNNVSIKEIAGNHAYQTTSASRPILRKNAVTGANYLEFDGSDDFLQTSNIDFTSTAKVSLFAGLVKNTSGTIGSIFEFSSNPLNNSGTFGAYTDINVSMRGYSVYSRGTAAVAASIQTSSMKASLVLMADISQDKITAQVNGVTSTTRLDQGTGNYGNYPLYIGRRGGAILPFNGHLYSLIGIGRLTTDSETIALEKAIAKNTGVVLSV